MMEEKNEDGLLSESTHNNEQLDRATEETVQRIQGLSEGTTTYGAVIDKAFAKIDGAADENKKSLKELAEEYQRLSEVISTVLKGIASEIAPLLNSTKQSGEGTDYKKFIGLDDYKKLFGQLDTLFPSTMIKLRNNLEGEWKKLDLSPEEVEKIKNKLDEATKTIKEKNPFTILIDVIKRYKKEEEDLKFKDAAKEAIASFRDTKALLDGVANAMPDRSAGQKARKELVSNISNVFGSVSDIAEGIMSKNLAKTVQGTVKLISSLYSGDKRIDIKIAEEAKELKNLENAYNNLDKAMNRALGSGKYDASKEAVENLQKQQESINRQIELEERKKKTDDKKITEYENTLESVKNKQIDLINKLRSEIMGIDAKSAAQQLGNAFIEAFGKGEGAIEAFGKKVDDIVGNIIKRMLIQKILEEPIGNILDQYSKRWIDDEGNFSSFDNVRDDAVEMGKKLKDVGPTFAKAMEELPDDIKKYFVGPESSNPSEGLRGAIKGASEETMNMAAGQLNAMRISQVELNGLIDDQLSRLSEISRNTAYLEGIYNKLNSMVSTDSLRAQGLS